MEKIKKIFNQKTRNILSIIIIILGVAFLINYIFYTPSYINAYIATNIYKEPANKYFDDDNFYECVVDAYNKENSTSIPYTQNLSDSQLGSIKEVKCSGYKKSDNVLVKSAKGIEKLTALTRLEVVYNQLTTLDVSKNTALTFLDLSFNRLTTLDVSNNTALTGLDVYANRLTTLDVSKNTALTYLNLNFNRLTTLDVSNNTALTGLNVYDNKLTTLDVSNNTELTSLVASSNKLTTLDVSNNTKLEWLLLDHNNLTTIDVSKNTTLERLEVEYNQLTTLDLSKNTALTRLHIEGNQLTTLGVSNNAALTELYAGENQLTTLDVSKNTKLTELYVYNNKLTTLDVSKNTALTWLLVYNNQLTTLDVSKNTALTYLNVNDNQLPAVYTKLNDMFSIDNSIEKGLILPEHWYIKASNNNQESLSFDGNNGKGLKVGKFVISFNIYNSHGYEVSAAKIYFSVSFSASQIIFANNEFTIYVYDVISDMYGIDKDNIYIGNDDSNEVILNNINIEYGNIDEKYKILTKEIKDNKLVIKHNNEVIKEYNLVKLEVSSNEYFVEDKEIRYVGEFDVNKINLNYGNKEVKDNKLVIKNNDKVIKEYNLVKLEVSSNEYFVGDKEIRYIGEFDVNKINLNYGSKEVKDNKLVIKYNDKVIKEYKLYSIKTNYSVINNTIYVGEDLNGENNILDRITSSDLNLSIDNDKLICKYNNEIINEFVLSSKNEYDIIDDYTKKNDIISRIPIDTDMNVFKTKINTNIGYIFKDSKNNDIVTNRKLRTGDKVIFNYSSGDIDYVLSVIGDVNGDGIINGKDIMEISNGIVGNKKLDNLSSLSGDIDNNGKMDIRDIIKMGNYIKKGKF